MSSAVTTFIAALLRPASANVLAVFAVISLSAFSQQLPFGDLQPGAVKPSVGCDATGLAPEERRLCLARALRHADGVLNTRYQDLIKTLAGEQAKALLTSQREWVKRRDATCAVDPRIGGRERWLDHVADDDSRLACVMRLTEERSALLAKMENQARSPVMIAEAVPGAAPAPAAVAASGPSTRAAAGQVQRSSRSRSSGKHYFEIVIEPSRIDMSAAASIIARVDDDRNWSGVAYDVRRQDLVLKLGAGDSITIVGGNLGDIRIPAVMLGVAVDLDAGRLYYHRDGAWQGGAPGSPGGTALSRGGDFRAELYSSVPLKPLIEQGVVAVNFGDKPFARAPAGYGGFDTDQPAMAAVAAKAVQAFSMKERVAGVDQAQWIRRYWEWVRSFPAGESPSADSTGYRCGAGQSGPVWFLTGSREPKPVSRECEIPEGKVLLVPIVNSLVQVNPGKETGCDELVVALGQFAAGATELRLKVDGAALEKPEQYVRGTGCFTLRDASSGQSGLAAGTGYWVFIKPLRKGRHEIEFGGAFPSHDFRQDVRYVLHVR